MVKIIHLNTGYNDDIIKPLFVKLPQMTSYINKFKDKKRKITTTTVSLFQLKMNNFLKIIIKYGKKLKGYLLW